MHFGAFPPLKGTPRQLAELTKGLTEVWALEPGVAVDW